MGGLGGVGERYWRGMADVYAELVRLQHLGEPCALCTITKTQGSTPGKTTMKMLVRRDGSFVGTVGGGCLEAEVLESALAAMKDERSRTLAFALNERDYPDSGLLCGGQLEVFVEPIVVPRLVLFGGGHVSGAIARIARLVGFHVSVFDDRAEFATRERHPDADETASAELPELVQRIAPAEDRYVIAVTRGHDKDGEVLEALFRAGAQPKYLGMIGSRAKRAQLFDQLQSRGVAPAFLERVRTPMGLPIGARTHEEIAVAVVAELISVRRLGASGTPPRDPNCSPR